MPGWVSTHRQIWDHWLWQDKPFSYGQAWIDILLLVNHSDNKILFNKKLETVKRGSRITSIRKLSERWGWSRTKTAKFLEMLESDKMIVKHSDTKKTLLTVVNYNTYQDSQDTKKTLKGHRKATEKPQRDTNNNDLNNDSIMNNNENKELSKFDQTLEDFKQHRKRLKKPMTDRAVKMLLNKLKELSPNESVQIKIMNESILQGWQGIFALKDNQNNSKGERKHHLAGKIDYSMTAKEYLKGEYK